MRICMAAAMIVLVAAGTVKGELFNPWVSVFTSSSFSDSFWEPGGYPIDMKLSPHTTLGGDVTVGPHELGINWFLNRGINGGTRQDLYMPTLRFGFELRRPARLDLDFGTETEDLEIFVRNASGAFDPLLPLFGMAEPGKYRIELNSKNHGAGRREFDISMSLTEWVPGDANEDRIVNQLDVIQMLQRDKYRSEEFATWTDGDFNGDGLFDQADLVEMNIAGEYGQGAFAAIGIPEPATIGLIAVALIGLLVAGRRPTIAAAIVVSFVLTGTVIALPLSDFESVSPDDDTMYASMTQYGSHGLEPLGSFDPRVPIVNNHGTVRLNEMDKYVLLSDVTFDTSPARIRVEVDHYLGRAPDVNYDVRFAARLHRELEPGFRYRRLLTTTTLEEDGTNRIDTYASGPVWYAGGEFPFVFEALARMPRRNYLDQAGVHNHRSNVVVDYRVSYPGDANEDYTFDANDLVQLLQSGKYDTGTFADWSMGDFNNDGFFDRDDVVLMLQAGKYNQGSYSAVSAIPEPATIGLIAVAFVGVVAFRRRLRFVTPVIVLLVATLFCGSADAQFRYWNTAKSTGKSQFSFDENPVNYGNHVEGTKKTDGVEMGLKTKFTRQPYHYRVLTELSGKVDESRGSELFSVDNLSDTEFLVPGRQQRVMMKETYAAEVNGETFAEPKVIHNEWSHGKANRIGGYGSQLFSVVTGSGFRTLRTISHLSLRGGDEGKVTSIVDLFLMVPGDANDDLVVDQQDIIQLLREDSYLNLATWNQGDFNFDGIFNQRDIVAMLQGGHYLERSYAALAPVPEPSTLLLGIIGLLLLGVRLKR